MGRIRTKDVKDVVNDMLEKYPDKFSDRFEENKEVITKINISQSKRHRNRIAGYMTRSVKNMRKK